MKLVRYAEALELLNQVVRDKGEGFVYDEDEREECVYIENGRPSCIVGHVFHALGVNSEFRDSMGEVRNVGGAVTVLHREGEIAFTQKAASLLQRVQVRQDNGLMWGFAVAQATASRELGGLDDTAPWFD